MVIDEYLKRKIKKTHEYETSKRLMEDRLNFLTKLLPSNYLIGYDKFLWKEENFGFYIKLRKETAINKIRIESKRYYEQAFEDDPIKKEILEKVEKANFDYEEYVLFYSIAQPIIKIIKERIKAFFIPNTDVSELKDYKILNLKKKYHTENIGNIKCYYNDKKTKPLHIEVHVNQNNKTAYEKVNYLAKNLEKKLKPLEILIG